MRLPLGGICPSGTPPFPKVDLVNGLGGWVLGFISLIHVGRAEYGRFHGNIASTEMFTGDSGILPHCL
ncbi:MAG: hypothetical protein FJX54_17675 [Alphaproteobacteria bacterium]|nr:hypothetical protein [Alphaproteobacteria bacterium]